MEQSQQEENCLYCKIKVNKFLYKALDSCQRREKWILKQLVNYTMEKYGSSTTSRPTQS